ncbi:hypothetical protein AHAS_Ahas12G0126400 [Arachis hypogaea]
MAENFDHLADVNAKNLYWSFKVFVVRAWDVPSKFNDKEVMSMELGLQDSKTRMLTTDKLDDSKLIGKEDPRNLVTSKGVETKRLAIILQDLELLSGVTASSLKISQVSSQGGRSGANEINQGAILVKTIEQNGTIWNCASIVSSNVGKDD